MRVVFSNAKAEKEALAYINSKGIRNLNAGFAGNTIVVQVGVPIQAYTNTAVNVSWSNGTQQLQQTRWDTIEITDFRKRIIDEKLKEYV